MIENKDVVVAATGRYRKSTRLVWVWFHDMLFFEKYYEDLVTKIVL